MVWSALSCLLLASLVLVSSASAQNQLTCSVAACGGERALSGTKTLTSTLGQAVVGLADSETLVHGIGFWRGVKLTQVGVEPPVQPWIPAFQLGPAVPNPVHTESAFSFSVPEQAQVTIRLFDVRGRMVRTLTDRSYPPGDHVVRMRARSLPAGVYWCPMTVDGREFARRLVVLP